MLYVVKNWRTKRGCYAVPVQRYSCLSLNVVTKISTPFTVTDRPTFNKLVESVCLLTQQRLNSDISSFHVT